MRAIGVASAALSCILLAAGCTFVRPAASPPTRRLAVHDQLVIHSNFKLARNHRLLEELTAQRYDLSQKLDLPVSDVPIHVYLFDSADEYDLFVRDYFSDLPRRRAFFVKKNTELQVYAHWGDRVAEDLRHEVAHGYLHAVLPSVPLWLDEGLAEYFEVPRGRQGVNSAHIELLSERRKAGNWTANLERLESLSSFDDLTQVDYAESWLWVHLLLESSSARRRLLHSYLDGLHEQGGTVPLSRLVHTQEPEADRMLLEHLERLVDR